MNTARKKLVLLSAFAFVGYAGCSSKPSADLPGTPVYSVVQKVSADPDGQSPAMDESTVASDATQTAKDNNGPESVNSNVTSKIAPPIIGQLRGRHHTIVIHIASDGPRFTVTTPDGRVVAAALSSDEMRAKHPAIYKTYEQSFAQGGAYLDASIGPLEHTSR